MQFGSTEQRLAGYKRPDQVNGKKVSIGGRREVKTEKG